MRTLLATKTVGTAEVNLYADPAVKFAVEVMLNGKCAGTTTHETREEARQSFDKVDALTVRLLGNAQANIARNPGLGRRLFGKGR